MKLKASYSYNLRDKIVNNSHCFPFVDEFTLHENSHKFLSEALRHFEKPGFKMKMELG